MHKFTQARLFNIVSRKITYCLLFILLITGCKKENESSSNIPVNSTYNIVVTGQGNFGPPFQQSASLFIVPTIADGTQQNGVNPVDVAIFTNQSPIVGAAGALYFATNTSLTSLIGSNLGASAIDVAFVQVNQANRSVSIQIDGNVFGIPAARLNTLNIYNLTTGLFAQIHNILAGTVNFNLNGDQVQGTIELGGSSGFQGPSISSLYVANFRGTRSR